MTKSKEELKTLKKKMNLSIKEKRMAVWLRSQGLSVSRIARILERFRSRRRRYYRSRISMILVGLTVGLIGAFLAGFAGTNDRISLIICIVGFMAAAVGTVQTFLWKSWKPQEKFLHKEVF